MIGLLGLQLLCSWFSHQLVSAIVLLLLFFLEQPKAKGFLPEVFLKWFAFSSGGTPSANCPQLTFILAASVWAPMTQQSQPLKEPIIMTVNNYIFLYTSSKLGKYHFPHNLYLQLQLNNEILIHPMEMLLIIFHIHCSTL